MKNAKVLAVAPTIMLIVLLAIGSCSGGRGSGLGETSAVPAERSDLNSVDIQSDVNAYTVPSDVDSDLFDLLSKKLIDDYRAFHEGKIRSAVTDEVHTINGSYINNGDGSYTFLWDYYNVGDYDLSGEVAVPDITPIANNYLNSTADGTSDRYESFIDGDGSGEIGISDITPIATNYLRNYGTVSGFFITAPENTLTSDEFLADGMFSVRGGFTPQTGDRVFVIDEDIESETYGQLRLTFQSDQIPTSAGEYVYVIRDVNDPPTFACTIPFVVGNPGPPVISDVSPLQGGVAAEVQFTTNLIQGLPPFTYAWDFGGGATPNESTDVAPMVTLGDEGQYNCTLTVTNDDGEDVFDFTLDVLTVPIVDGVTPSVFYEWTESTVSANASGVEPFTYEWSFGGGADPDTSTEASPVFTTGAPGDYEASVTVTNAFGSTDYDWTMTVIDRKPEVHSITPLSGYTGERLQMAADVSGLAPIAYQWDFGGAATSNTSTNESPMITLTGAGIYNCTLAVSNEYGNHSYPFQFEVTAGTPDITDIAPLSGITGSQLSPVATVTGMQPIQYSWDFGGGAEPNLTTDPNPTVTLSSTKGSYSGNLTVLNPIGQDTYEFTLVVQELPTPPEILSVTPTTGDSGSQITLTADVAGSYPRFYSWDFDTGADPNTSTSDSPTVTLQDPGTYKASVTLTNSLGDFKYDFDLVVLPIAGQWTNELVDGGTGLQCGMYTDMVFLPTGEPLIAYQTQLSTINYIVKTAILRETGWEIQDLDTMNGGLGGYNIDIDLDVNNNHVIAYEYRCDADSNYYNDLKLAWWNGTSYDFSTVDSDGTSVLQCAKNISLDFAPSGKGLIAHWQMAGQHDPFDIRSVIWDGTTWTGEKIGEDAWEVCGILDSTENPIIACAFDTTFELKWYDGSAWQPTTLLSDTGNNISNISMALAPDGNPAITWYDYRPVNNGDLYFAKWDGSAWITETVETWNDVGKYSCLVYSPDGKPYISYFNETKDWLQVSRKESTTWVRTYVDKGGRTGELVGKFTAMGFGPDNKPHIAYWQFTNGDFGLRYATLH
jgi:PKD repeat protein